METVWTAVQEQRTSAERLGLAVLRATHAPDADARDPAAFRESPPGPA